MTSKLYQRPNSKYWYADFDTWDREKQKMVRKRVSTGALDKDQAALVLDGLESAAKAAQTLSGQTISRKHLESLLVNLLTTAGVAIEDEKPLPLLREFVESYLTDRKSKISAGSYLAYRTSHRKFESWMDTLPLKTPPRLEWLSIARVEQYYDWMRNEENLTAKTAKDHVKWLGRAMKRAVQRTDLPKNPVDGLELDKEGETLDRLPFQLKEAKKLIKWMLSQGDREREWARLTMLSLMSGCRIEDALTMQQENISGAVLSYTQKKTKKSVSFPLVVPQWLKVIAETKKGPIAPKLHYEFTKWSNSKLSHEFTEMVSKAGIKQEYRQFKSGRKVARKTFHSLRHTLRTAIVSSGGSDAQADVILGHSEGEGKRYTHSEVEAMERTLRKALE